MLRDNPGYSYYDNSRAAIVNESPTPVPVTCTLEVEVRADEYDELMAYDGVDVHDLALQYVEADSEMLAMREKVRDFDRDDFRQLIWLIDSDIRYRQPIEGNRPKGCSCKTCFTVRTWNI